MSVENEDIVGIPLGQHLGRFTPSSVLPFFESTAISSLSLSFTNEDMSRTLDHASETVPRVVLALEKLFKNLEDGLKITEESVHLVTGLIRELGTKFDVTEALYRKAPSPEPKSAQPYPTTRSYIFDNLKTIAEKSADASMKGQILSGQALTLCEVANEYQRETPDYVASMRGVADGAYIDATAARDTFRTLCYTATKLKDEYRTSLKNRPIGLPHNHAFLESLKDLLDLLATENLGGSGVHRTKQVFFDRLVFWWEDIRKGLDDISASLDCIPFGTVIRLKRIETTWRDLSNRFRRYGSQLHEALDNLEARKLSVTMWGESGATNESHITSGGAQLSKESAGAQFPLRAEGLKALELPTPQGVAGDRPPQQAASGPHDAPTEQNSKRQNTQIRNFFLQKRLSLATSKGKSSMAPETQKTTGSRGKKEGKRGGVVQRWRGSIKSLFKGKRGWSNPNASSSKA